MITKIFLHAFFDHGITLRNERHFCFQCVLNKEANENTPQYYKVKEAQNKTLEAQKKISLKRVNSKTLFATDRKKLIWGGLD